MKPRLAISRVRGALSDTPVVFVHGARQVGKTTLVRALIDGGYQAQYVTLDDAVALAAAAADPAGFLRGYKASVVIDEVQRAPGLILAIKAAVDEDRRPGRFLLTGSANVLMLPSLADSLAGRMEIVTLWPLSQGEIDGTSGSFVDRAFATEFEAHAADAGGAGGEGGAGRTDIVHRVLRGGYPEAVARERPDRRAAWFGAYLTTILQRDVRDLASIERLDELPRLLALIASRTGGLLSYSDLAGALSMPQSTLKRYFALLEQTFMARRLPAWASNRGVRLAKSPKVHVCDTGLAAHLAGIDEAFLARQPTALGGLLETFVVMELTKQLGWSAASPAAYHFRTANGREVDLVLERRSGELIGIEVKAGATVGDGDFAGLRALRDAAGDAFRRGFVAYLGPSAVSFGEDMHAIPAERLWGV